MLATPDRSTISIHALREEGDTDTPEQLARYKISIHALREEGDQPARQSCPPPVGFLSTPSARRATLHPSISPCCTPKFLSTPSARRATWTFHKTHLTYTISIHALREEGDVTERSCSSTWLISIHALREEGDIRYWETAYPAGISIHALREEGDRSGKSGRAEF